jgi:hypothetical protein
MPLVPIRTAGLFWRLASEVDLVLRSYYSNIPISQEYFWTVARLGGSGGWLWGEAGSSILGHPGAS